MTNNNLLNVLEKKLLDVTRCLRSLARQESPLQESENNDNFTQLMMLLGTKDESIIAHLDATIRNKYTHHDIQNELLNMMYGHVLLPKLETIDKRVFF